MGWDTVDEHSARFFNWSVVVFTDLKVHHQRKTNFKFGYLKAKDLIVSLIEYFRNIMFCKNPKGEQVGFFVWGNSSIFTYYEICNRTRI